MSELYEINKINKILEENVPIPLISYTNINKKNLYLWKTLTVKHKKEDIFAEVL